MYLNTHKTIYIWSVPLLNIIYKQSKVELPQYTAVQLMECVCTDIAVVFCILGISLCVRATKTN